jgi:hypothetical protein
MHFVYRISGKAHWERTEKQRKKLAEERENKLQKYREIIEIGRIVSRCGS